MAQIRRDDLHDGEEVSEQELSAIIEAANETLEAIDRSFRDMKEADQKLAAEASPSLEARTDELRIEQEEESMMELQAADAGAGEQQLSKWTIEGMYTDHGWGPGFGPQSPGKNRSKALASDAALFTPSKKSADPLNSDLTGKTITVATTPSTGTTAAVVTPPTEKTIVATTPVTVIKAPKFG